MQEKFIQSLASKFRTSQGQQFVKWLKVPNTYMRVLQGIQCNDKMTATQQIMSNQQIFLVSTEKCFTSVELIGCDKKKTQELNTLAQQIASKYYGSNPQQEQYVNGLIKIILQLFVHRKDPNQILSPFANFVQANNNNPIYWNETMIGDISSNHLRNVIQSTLAQCQNMYQELQFNKIYGLQPKEFLELFQIVRQHLICFNPSKPKFYDMQSVLIMSPLIQLFSHSFNPNCYVDGCYFSHENMSYVELSSKRAIEPGEELTINYGELSNYDLMMRHSVYVKDNPFNEMTINLDFTNWMKFAIENTEEKQRLLHKSEIKDIERITLYTNRINSDLLQYLRIYFSDGSLGFEEYKNKISDENENLLKSFMQEQLQELKNEYKKSQFEDINNLQNDELRIIDANLQYFSQ